MMIRKQEFIAAIPLLFGSLIPTLSHANTDNSLPYQTDISNASYAVGYSYAQILALQIENQKKMGITFDESAILDGFKDALSHSPKLTKNQIDAVLTQLDTKTKAQRIARDSENSEENYQSGIVAQKAALSAPGAFKTESGLIARKVKSINLPVGDSPKDTDKVRLEYKGYIVGGVKFDDTSWRSEPSIFVVSDLLPGLREGVKLMKVGEEYEFMIKPELAYGNKKTPMIPINSTLAFDVTLKEITK